MGICGKTIYTQRMFHCHVWLPAGVWTSVEFKAKKGGVECYATDTYITSRNITFHYITLHLHYSTYTLHYICITYTYTYTYTYTFTQHYIDYIRLHYIYCILYTYMGMGQYLQIHFSGMNIHLPAILRFTRYQGFDPSPYIYIYTYCFSMG